MLVKDIRHIFAKKFQYKEFKGDTIDINGASFLCDERTIFGKRNEDYINAEIAWYESEDCNVNKLFEIYGKEVKIWKDICDDNGFVNSQYGYLVFSEHNHDQYNNCFNALVNDPNTRQAIMIYTRPEMHYESTDNGRYDFTCTNAVHYYINGKWLDVVVQMRSNDAVFGYNNDYAWQRYVQQCLLENINEYRYENDQDELELGTIRWQVGSLHVYKRHFHLLEEYVERYLK